MSLESNACLCHECGETFHSVAANKISWNSVAAEPKAGGRMPECPNCGSDLVDLVSSTVTPEDAGMLWNDFTGVDSPEDGV